MQRLTIYENSGIGGNGPGVNYSSALEDAVSTIEERVATIEERMSFVLSSLEDINRELDSMKEKISEINVSIAPVLGRFHDFEEVKRVVISRILSGVLQAFIIAVFTAAIMHYYYRLGG